MGCCFVRLLYRPGLRRVVGMVFLIFAELPEASCCPGTETWHSLHSFTPVLSVLRSSFWGFAKGFTILLSLGSWSFLHTRGLCSCSSCLLSILPKAEPYWAKCVVVLPGLALISLSNVLLDLSIEKSQPGWLHCTCLAGHITGTEWSSWDPGVHYLKRSRTGLEPVSKISVWKVGLFW